MRNEESDEQKILEIANEMSEIDEVFMFSTINCYSPYQIEAFWIECPLEYQYLFLTHDDNRENEKVIINGPYSGSEFLDELEKILLKPRWQQPVDESMMSRFDYATSTSFDISTRRDIVISLFQGIEQDLGGEVFRETSTQLRQLDHLENDNWFMRVRGNLLELDSIEELLANTFDEYQQTSQEENEQEISPFNEDTNGLGTYIYEPIWVGGVPDLNFKDRILIKPPIEYDMVYSEQIGEYEVAITKDGFVGVTEPDDKSAVLEILNTIFGTSILIEHPFEAATRDDLIEIVIDDDQNILDRRGDPGSRRRSVTLMPATSYEDHGYGKGQVERTLIDEEYLKNLWSLSKEVYDNEEMKERVNSTLQAYTHHVNGEYTQAFLLAWISIEQYIITKLPEYLKENKNVNSDRRRKMQRGGHWSASHLIELMEISNCISKSRYKNINKMRKRRNEIVHNIDSATEGESKKIVDLSFNLINEQFFDSNEGAEFV